MAQNKGECTTCQVDIKAIGWIIFPFEKKCSILYGSTLITSLRNDRMPTWFKTFLIWFLIGAGCREKNPSDQKVPPHAYKQLDSRNISKMPISATNLDSLTFLLADIEQRIMHCANDHTLQQVFLHHAFDTLKGGFHVAGTGLSPKNSIGGNLLAKKAAEKTALRWALYAKSWHLNVDIAFGTPISGTISYHTPLVTIARNDTIYQLIFVPLGSIEIH